MFFEFWSRSHSLDLQPNVCAIFRTRKPLLNLLGYVNLFSKLYINWRYKGRRGKMKLEQLEFFYF